MGKDQEGFDSVEQASIGTSKMDHGIESNDGQEMDQEWNQVFAMMEQVELAHNLSDFVVKPSLERIPPGMFVCSKTPPNLINHSPNKTVYHRLCNCLLKGNTQSYYRSPKSYDSRKKSHVNNTGNHDHSER